MRLEKLSLYNFKNYREAHVKLNGNIHCLVGKNGSGKTNLLDAIHYLSFTKSCINPSDQQSILDGENHFLIKGEFDKNSERRQVMCSFQLGQKKVVRENDMECERLSAHLGRFPVVLVAPGDVELIWDGSERRRKFFDSILSQTDKHYLESLITYNQFLKQRNSLLRLFYDGAPVDQDMLSVYAEKLVPAAEYIYGKRKGFLAEFLGLFESHYRFLSGNPGENIMIAYESQLHNSDFRETLRQNLQRDILLQRTTMGIHRDDFLFTIHGGELKRLGSQGEQKSFLIGLKLAEFQIIHRSKGHTPLLLLDDIFDKLDDERIGKLMELVAGGSFGQLLITDARYGRSPEILRDSGLDAEFFQIENGTLKGIHEKAQKR